MEHPIQPSCCTLDRPGNAPRCTRCSSACSRRVARKRASGQGTPISPALRDDPAHPSSAEDLFRRGRSGRAREGEPDASTRRNTGRRTPARSTAPQSARRESRRGLRGRRPYPAMKRLLQSRHHVSCTPLMHSLPSSRSPLRGARLLELLLPLIGLARWTRRTRSRRLRRMAARFRGLAVRMGGG